tara:strand:- start:635 stop:2590 length:1956 start_codon:yes stop_codon:yes gene_type:complete
MIYRKNYLIFLVIISSAKLFGQDKGHLIFSYGGSQVYQTEFERAFSKNNNFDKQSPSDSAIQEYLELYIKFKLKVSEAYRQKLDTQKSFKNELAGYRKQLAQPYLVDKKSNEKLIKEAYERYLKEVNASHIMVSLPTNPSPADTLKAYKKAIRYYNQIKSGELNFDSTAYQFSEDQSAKLNFGKLGYFTAFSMIYPFEGVAYNTPIGEISKPFKTRFGYHIVKVHDRRMSQGKIKVAHIMKRFNNEQEVEDAKTKIEEIYKRLNEGETFESLVNQFSEDFNSRKRGGELQAFRFTDNNIPLEFREAAFALKSNGDYSSPMKTKYSWHIIKRIDLKPIGSFEMLEEQMKIRVSRDGRNSINKAAMIDRLINENGITEFPKQIENTFSAIVGDSVRKPNWTPSEDLFSDQVLFTIKTENYTQKHFIEHIKLRRFPKNQNIYEVLKKYYINFKNESIMNFEEGNLEIKYPDFKYLVREYEEGILLFELMDKEVWSKASQDSSGIEEFFEKNKTNYMWEERAEVDVYELEGRIAKKVIKFLNIGKDKDWIIQKFNKKDPLAASVSSGMYEKSQKDYLQNIEQIGIIQKKQLENGHIEIVHVKNILPVTQKELSETKGLVTADYQKYLEIKWIEQLKKLYPVKINEEGVKHLFKSN